MPKHLWMQDIAVAAYCPKCGNVAFKRSNTRSGYEKLMRRYTSKVPYRCHECSYRSMIDPAVLRFPATSHSKFEEHDDFSSKVEVPDIRITSIIENDSEKDKPNAKKSEEEAEVSLHIESTELPNEDDNGEVFISSAEELSSEQHSDDIADAAFPDFTNENVEKEVVQQHHREHVRKMSLSCPSCGEKSLYRSHSRSVIETTLKKVSRKRLYRCHACDWRGWLHKHL